MNHSLVGGNKQVICTIFIAAALSLYALAAESSSTTEANITAESNITANDTSPISTTPNQTRNVTAPHSTPPEIPSPPNTSTPEPALPLPLFDFDVQKIIPGDLRIGDSQINILVVNTGNQVLRNLNALVSGEGVSVYNQEPIALLSPGDSKWLLAWVNTKKTGKIPLEVRIQDKQFRLHLNVLDTEQTMQAKKAAEDAAAHRRRVREIQDELTNLSDIYEAFSRDYVLKESKQYILTSVNLQDAKTYLRTAQSALAKDELNDASANLILLRSELADVREKLSKAAPKPRTWRDPLKDNIAILSGIVGVAVGGLAVYEKLKNKKEELKRNGGWFGKKEKKWPDDQREEE